MLQMCIDDLMLMREVGLSEPKYREQVAAGKLAVVETAPLGLLSVRNFHNLSDVLQVLIEGELQPCIGPGASDLAELIVDELAAVYDACDFELNYHDAAAIGRFAVEVSAQDSALPLTLAQHKKIAEAVESSWTRIEGIVASCLMKA